MKSKFEDYTSKGNVFEDLGLPDSDELLVKAQLAVQIRILIEKKGWKQARVAKQTGLDQPKVSRLLHGKLSGFSVDRLLSILNHLGHAVEVRISEKECKPKDAHTFVTCARG